jgi:hypothetical protein
MSADDLTRTALALIVLLSAGDEDGAKELLSGRPHDELVEMLIETARVQLGNLDPIPAEVLAETRQFLAGES